MRLSLAVLLAMLAGCAGSTDGPCKVTGQDVLPADAKVLGDLTVAQLEQSLTGVHPGTLTYLLGEGNGSTPVHVEVSEPGAAVVVHSAPPDPANKAMCPDSTQIPAKLHFHTEDGRFDETGSVTINVAAAGIDGPRDTVSLYLTLDPAHLHGTFKLQPGDVQPGETATLELGAELPPGQDSSGQLILSTSSCSGQMCQGAGGDIATWGQH